LAGKDNAARLSKDGEWRSFPRVPHLLQYLNSGAYYARIKIKGKIIRESFGESLAATVWPAAHN
jgi:hypothetical protein